MSMMQVYDSATVAATTFTVMADTLVKALRQLDHKCFRTTIPILENVRVTSDGNELALITTNLDHMFAVRIDHGGLPAFDTTVNYKQLLAYAKSKAKAAILVDVAFGFSVDGINLLTLPASDFPMMDSQSEKATVSFGFDPASVGALRAAISTEETRYYLNGLFVHAIDGFVKFVACDGHRLSKLDANICLGLDVDFAENASDFGAYIMPRTFIDAIVKQKAGRLYLSKSGCAFTNDSFRIDSRVIEGSFPDYIRVIPTHTPIQVMVNRKALAMALKPVMALSKCKSTSVAFQFGNDGLNLRHRIPEGETFAANIPVKDSDYLADLNGNDSFEIGFNARYVLDLLDGFTSETVLFTMSENSNPVRLDENGLTCVLMPLRV